MRILFVTQYYIPETGAPQNRLSGLAKELIELGVEVEVLTAMPNYPRMEIFDSFRKNFSLTEMVKGVKVHRAWIYVSKSRSIFSRLLNYFSFTATSYMIAGKAKGRFDFVFCESPPLFLGMSAQRIARRKKAKLIFNVSDLWPESAEKLGLVTNRLLLKMAYRLEASLYRKSVLVTGQTQGICRDIEKRFPTVKTHWLPNGIDPGRFSGSISSSWRGDNKFNSGDFILLYAGIIGYAQGLDIVLLAAEKLKTLSEIKFVLVGDGPEKERLLQRAQSMKLSNVFFFDSVSGSVMPQVIEASNAALIPLRKLELFKGAIPSKIFENLAMKKPVLLGVEGEAKELFIDDGRCGLFFQPEDHNDLAEKILKLKSNPQLTVEMGNNGCEYVYRFFNRKIIAVDFLEKLNEISNTCLKTNA